MADQLYKKNESGAFEVVAPPEGRAKAEAMRTYLARGGGLTKRASRRDARQDEQSAAVYKKGPLRGMTQAEAEIDFENKWQSVDGSIKDNYAKRAGNVLSPSEISAAAGGERLIPGLTPKSTNASLNSSLPGESPSQTAERQKRSRIRQYQGDEGLKKYVESQKPKPRHDQDGNGIPDMVQRPAEQKPAVSDSVAIGTPEEQARAAQVAAESSDIQTAAGGGFTADISALQKRNAAIEAAKPPSTNHRGGKAIVTPPTAPVIGNFRGGQPPVAPAQTFTAPIQPPAGQPAQAVGSSRPQTAAEGNNSPAFKASNVAYGKIADERMAPGGPAAVTASGPIPSPTRGRPEPTRSASIEAPDFTPGDGKEMSGMSAGRPTYAPKVAGITATPAMRAAAQNTMERDGVVPMQPRQIVGLTPVRQPSAAVTPPVRKDDPDIIRKDNVAAANYQSSFSGGNPSDAEFNAAKNGQKALYDNASSMDQARLVVNTLKRNAALDDTRNAPRARVVQPAKPIIPGMTPMRQPMFRR